jgi:glycerol-3-phosphate O-acyltransferase
MTTLQPVVQAQDRLAGFNAEREQILDLVHRRIMDARLAASQRGGDDSLEYVLNDVVFSEMRRLEKASDPGSQRQLQRWRDLANRLLRMSEADKRAELDSLIQHYCRDIVGNFDPRVFRFASGVLPPAMSLLLSPLATWRQGIAALTESSRHIYIEGPLDAIRSACERGALVFTPTHSSNLDSIVLAWALVLSRLPPVTYGAGKNLFSNPFISYFMHNLGAYRVDRRLQFSLYKDVLKEYSTVLLERGYHSLFFPGGTRCRSNMVDDRLKLGLLGTALAAYVNNLHAGMPERRIYIVPVTINYRLVLEAETLIDDYLAETGRSRYIIQDDEFSRLGRIVEFARKTLVHEGAVTMHFGRPLDPLGNMTDDQGESLDSRGRRVDLSGYVRDRHGRVSRDAQRDAEYTRRLGSVLVEQYHRLVVFLPTHLVARVLMDEVVRQAGTRDIYRLLRAGEEVRRVAMARVREGVERLRARIAAEPGWGSVQARFRSASASALVDEALGGLMTYHTHPAAVARGDDVCIEDMKLIFYYQNRLSHVPVEVRP